MTKHQTSRFLIAFHTVVFAAVFLRIDTFPLTWVPMYSLFHGEKDLVVPVGDMPQMKQGFAVTLQSGEKAHVGPKELNIPTAAFRRLYYERAFGKGPPKHLRERVALNAVSDRLFDLFYEDPATSINWEQRLLRTMNSTLERQPEDADFIIQATARSDFTRLSPEQRRQGDFSNLRLFTQEAVLSWVVTQP